MRKIAILSALLFAASLAGAQQPTKEMTAARPAPAADANAKTHEIPAEFVAYNDATQTLTIKGAPENKTLPVDAMAVPAVKNLRSGQKVTLVCRDNEKGEHQAVAGVMVNPAKAPARKDEKQ
jgi:phage baseplate assembly protein gpV